MHRLGACIKVLMHKDDIIETVLDGPIIVHFLNIM